MYNFRAVSILRLLEGNTNYSCVLRRLTYYEILGVTPEDSETKVKDAYIKLSKQYHPDTNAAKGLDTHDQFVAINEAYHILSQSDLKKQYDNDISGLESIFDRAANTNQDVPNPGRSSDYKNPYHQFDKARQTADRWSDYYTPYAYSRARRFMERDIDSDFWKKHWEHNIAHGGCGPQVANHDPSEIQGKWQWKSKGRVFLACGLFALSLFITFAMYVLVYDGKLDFEKFHRDLVALTIRRSW